MIHMAVMVCLAMSTLQRGAMDSLAEQVEELRATVRSSEASSDDRNDALQECLVLRSQVLNSGELDDTAQAILMCDQAEDLIGTGLALEQLGMTIMFGYPTEAESDRARARIKAGLAMVSKAELAVERAIFDLERIPASKRTATQRESLLRLREQERDRRLPLLRGAGLVHRAEGFEQNAARQATMQEAAFDLEALRERLNDAALVRATWLHGLALARLNRYDDAEAAFREAATSASASAADMLAARLGGVVNRSHQGGPDRGVRSADKLQARYVDAAQLRERLLIVDHLARLHAANGRYGEAAAAWGSLHGPLADAGLDAKTARALLDERIRRLPVSDPQQMKSAELLLAHAHREELDAGRLASALRVVLNSNALEQRQRARALSALALALVRSGESLQAVEPLLELARTMPEAPEAGPGIDLAARLSLQHSLAHPTDAAARALSAESLGLLLSSFSDRPGIDGWRLAAGRLAASDGRLADAMAAYESIRPGAKEEQEALRESAAILLRASRQAGAQRGTLFDEMRARRGRGDEATVLAIDLLLVEALLDAQRNAEAAELIRSLAGASLSESQEASVETLRLRAAEGDPASLAEAARGVAERGGADGGLAIASSLRQAMGEILAEEMRTGNPVAPARVQQEIEPLVDALLNWLEHHRSDDAASWLLVIEGLRRSGRSAEALEAANRMLAMHPDAGELLFERAENLYILGGEQRLADAMSIYRRLTRVPRESAPRRWWWSQLRMLEILAVMERNTDRIAPRIRRLMDDDESMGGADVLRGFQALLIRFQ